MRIADCGKDDDGWLVGRLVKALEDLPPVRDRHHEGEDHKVRVGRCDLVQGFTTVSRRLHDVPGRFQDPAHQQPEIGRASCRERVYVLV